MQTLPLADACASPEAGHLLAAVLLGGQRAAFGTQWSSNGESPYGAAP